MFLSGTLDKETGRVVFTIETISILEKEVVVRLQPTVAFWSG